ncbi:MULTISPECIES: ABC transporter permease [Actinomyces]|uniref:ABC transporter permease n=1 Tax=Actinomyces respiraculi TaxID=2744574 RepID=A0A7T0LLK7_9ACTO|nr:MULTISPECIES: ABC transporter permease [Actinomyces]QPL05593.1 ABC transporter permease [Actinomyces respiraculi]
MASLPGPDRSADDAAVTVATADKPAKAVEASHRSASRSLRRSRLRLSDVLRLGGTGIKARPTRAFLSALGIAIGIAAMIAVVGISASSRAQLTAQLDSLGTNLLTTTAGQDLFGNSSPLPQDAVGKVRLIDKVESASSTGVVKNSLVYRSPLIDRNASGGITTMAADLSLLDVVAGQIDRGTWLNEATSQYPATVLGQTAARRLGVVTPGTQVWLGGRWFTVVGILKPVVLAPELDNAALIGQGVATSLLGHEGNPTTLYTRTADSAVNQVRDLLAPSISPQSANEVKVSRPSDALEAKNAADQAFTSLLLGVGSIALLVGGIGVANTMIISVLERRREIGLRRSLGAMRGHILVQFMAEALLLSTLGGTLGCVIGIGVTAGMASANGWPFSLPVIAVAGGLGATIVIGALAGVYPAVRAARTPPTAALNAQ